MQVIAAPATMALVYSFRTDPWSHPRRMMLWAVLVVLVIPLVGGVVAGRVGDWAGISGPNHQPLDSSGISRLVRQVVAKLIPNPVAPTGWDALFLQRPPHGAFVIVEYDDGHKVCGCFASQSFAITSPEAHAVFLQEEWQLDDGGAITRRVAGTGGVLISQTDDIRIVHIVLGDSESAETEETVDG